MNGPQRVALGLAIAPLVLGSLILGSWLVTRWSWLEFAGVLLIYVGFVITLVVALLLVHGWRVAVRHGSTASQQWRSTLLVSVVMLANYPAAGAAMKIALRAMSEFGVTVVNEASTPWTNVVIEGGGEHLALPDLMAGATCRRAFWFTNDGHLVLRAPDLVEPVVIEDYVTDGMPGGVTVVRKIDGRLVVTETAIAK